MSRELMRSAEGGGWEGPGNQRTALSAPSTSGDSPDSQHEQVCAGRAAVSLTRSAAFSDAETLPGYE